MLNSSTKTEILKLDFFSYIKALFNLMKPRVMSLVIFTCVVGLLIAPVKINFLDAIFSLIAVALGSGAAGALNMWYEADLDSLMTRTCLRPIPTGKVTRNQALVFGILSSIAFNKTISKNKIFYTTGRLTSEMVIKTVKMKIPILISRSGFTSWGVELAKKTNLTLIGRAKGKKYIILSGEKRIDHK